MNSIRRQRLRFDFKVIAQWILAGERVLDLGCGDGALLDFLQKEVGAHGYGIENDPSYVLECVSNGVNVLQFDLEEGLQGIEDNSFDHVIMSLSLQTVHRTEQMLFEMLRVGNDAVVSFPNFGYKPRRDAIADGHMPASGNLPYHWYDSPNVRFFTIADFEGLCAEKGIAVRERLAFANDQPVSDNPNLNADMAIYRLGRGNT